VAQCNSAAAVDIQATLPLDLLWALPSPAPGTSDQPGSKPCHHGRGGQAQREARPGIHWTFAFSQSFKNWSSPLSVKGCLNSWSKTLNGMVATSAPAFAASTMCSG